MADHSQPRDAASEESTAEATQRVLTGPDVLDATLPEDVQAAFARLLDDDAVDTLGEWTAEIRERTGGGSIGVDDLCHVPGPSDHYGETPDETYHFACFFDAVVLAALVDETVDVHTESPSGVAVEATATDAEDLSATPPEAVVSFGVSEDVDPPADGEPTHGDVYAAVCPYVRAFPNAATYAEWAADAPAATIAVPMTDATAFAAALVE
jgi:alkylmercury lyase